MFRDIPIPRYGFVGRVLRYRGSGTVRYARRDLSARTAVAGTRDLHAPPGRRRRRALYANWPSSSRRPWPVTTRWRDGRDTLAALDANGWARPRGTGQPMGRARRRRRCRRTRRRHLRDDDRRGHRSSTTLSSHARGRQHTRSTGRAAPAHTAAVYAPAGHRQRSLVGGALLTHAHVRETCPVLRRFRPTRRVTHGTLGDFRRLGRSDGTFLYPRHFLLTLARRSHDGDPKIVRLPVIGLSN